jgi:hypothetical protein
MELGPLGKSATERPIVPAPGDCDDGGFDGMKSGRGNRSTRTKLSQRYFVHRKSHFSNPGLNPRRRGGKPETNRLSYGAAIRVFTNRVIIWCYVVCRTDSLLVYKFLRV